MPRAQRMPHTYRRVGQREFSSMRASMCLAHSPAYRMHIFPRKYNFLLYFICWFGEKTQFFKPNPTRNMSINPNPPGNLRINIRALIRNYSFIDWRFKRKEIVRSVKGGVSPILCSQNMFYFFCNLFLVTMSY